jgi:hypothetical protein
MGRPPKLDINKRYTKDKNGLIIKNSTKDMYEKVKKVCVEHNETGESVFKICKRMKVNCSWFYRSIATYANCKEVANRHGVGVRGDAEIRPAKILNKNKPAKDAYTMFDMPCRKEWTDEQKQTAIQTILKELRAANSLAKAVCYANANMEIVSKWMREEPGVGDIIRRAEAECSSYMGKCVVKSMGVAAEKGKVGEVILGAERRFPEQWGKIDSIDITTRNDQNQKHILTISGDEARMLDAEMEIEEI